MKFTISREHKKFFEERRAIEFEALLEKPQIEQLNAELQAALAKRLSLKVSRLAAQSPENLFRAGRDLWRIDAGVKKLVANTRFAEIAAQLTGQRIVRLGYDQYFPSPMHSIFPLENESAYAQLLQTQRSLEAISALQGIVCGLMLCLNDSDTVSDEQHDANAETIKVFSDIAGNGFFFAPSATLDFQNLYKRVGQNYLLIVYTHGKAVYVFNQSDPLHHSLTNVGYSLGDKLKDTLNPILFRE